MEKTFFLFTLSMPRHARLIFSLNEYLTGYNDFRTISELVLEILAISYFGKL